MWERVKEGPNRNSGDQSEKENVTTRSLDHLYIPYAKPVRWCDGLTGQARASGASEHSRRLMEVTQVVAQAHHVVGVSAAEGK